MMKTYTCVAMMIGRKGYPYEEVLIRTYDMKEANRAGLMFTKHCDNTGRICLGFYLREE